MKLTRHLLEGIKLIALFGAIALVVWSMPEHGGDLRPVGQDKVAVNR